MIDASPMVPTLRPAFRLMAEPRQYKERGRLRVYHFEYDVAEAVRPDRWDTAIAFRWRDDEDASRVVRPAPPRPTRKVDESPDAYRPQPRYRIGSLAGKISVPDDFDTMGQDAIEQMFEL